MRGITSGIGALALLTAAACQQVPTGPTASEGLYNSLVAQCSAQGNRDHRGQTACAQANSLAMQVSAERSQRDAQASSAAQNNAVTAGVAAGAAGLLGGAIIGQATAPHRYYPYRACGPFGCRWY